MSMPDETTATVATDETVPSDPDLAAQLEGSSFRRRMDVGMDIFLGAFQILMGNVLILGAASKLRGNAARD